jgi:hypothetical protein
MSTNTEYITKMQTQLQAWDNDVDALRARGRTIATEARAAYFGRIKELRSSRDAAHKAFQEIRCASEEAGTQLHAGMQGAWETMRSTLDKITADLRS